MKLSKHSGATLAAAAAVMILGGVGATPAAAEDAKVHCYGVNACKGQGKCGTATNSCAGKNACKGQGWEELTAADCKSKGGEAK